MKTIVISKKDTQCSDVINYTGEGAEYYSWKSFVGFIKDVNWLGFSNREVLVKSITENEAVIECHNNLIDDYLMRLCECSSIDFKYNIL